MPLLGNKPHHLVPKLEDVKPGETIYTVEHTKEQFRSKAEYEKRLKHYKEKIWTCQCTGHLHMTHEEAWQSEEERKQILHNQFPKYFEQTVLEEVHHNLEALDLLVDKCWTKLQQYFVPNEPITLKVKSTGKPISGVIVKREDAEPEAAAEGSKCNSPSSDKENKTVNQTDDGSPKKWTPPRILPYKYTVRLEGEEKIISGVPASDLVRRVRPPSKDLVKLFIRCHAIRPSNNHKAPWVVSDDLVKVYNLPSKFADLFIAMMMNDSKSSDTQNKKRKKSGSLMSPNKKMKLTKGQSTLKLVKQGEKSPTKKTKSPAKSPQKTGSSPRKCSPGSAKKSPKKGREYDHEASSSDDEDLSLASIRASENKSKMEDSDSDSDVALADLTPLSELTPINSQSQNAVKKKKTPQGTMSTPGSTPGTPGSGKKRGRPKGSKNKPKMKQVTLLEMSQKRPRGRPPKNPKSPTKTPSGSPTKSQPRSPRKNASPNKIPKVAIRLQKALQDGKKSDIKHLLMRCAIEIPRSKFEVLPPTIRNTVERKLNQLEEKRKMRGLTAEQKVEYKKQKKLDQKKKLREKLRGQNKKCEDTDLDLTPLPSPKIVQTPDGIANELFGDVAMVTEFVSCYKGLLMPEEEIKFDSGLLMQALADGKEGFLYLSQILIVLLQTLLQDGISEGYKEIDVRLADIAVNKYNASELLRLCLQSAETGDEDSDLDQDDMEDQVPTELTERMENAEMYTLQAEEKLQILSALCHRIMGTYVVQDYLEEKQTEATSLWKQRIAKLKAKNDKLKQEKQKRKEEKKNGGAVPKEEPEKKPPPPETDLEKKPESPGDNMTITSFYGKQPSSVEASDDPEDLASVVKRRRVMAARAAQEKAQREKEDRIRRQKEAEEQRKVREAEAFEKQFQDTYLISKRVLRHVPIGSDRNHSRYWIFENSSTGIYVEKGWAGKYIGYTLKEDSTSSESELEDSPKRGRPKRHNLEAETTFPHAGQNLWFVYDTKPEVDKLLATLHPLGLREGSLKTELQKQLQTIEKMLAVKREPEEKVNGDTEMVQGFKNELLDMEMRLRNGGLGGVPVFSDWQERLNAATTLEALGSMMVEVQENILSKFIKGMMIVKSKTATKKEDQNDENKEGGDDAKGDADDDAPAEIPPAARSGVDKWKEAISECSTFSRLHVLLSILESCIKWEKSAENAKCKICRKKGDETRLLLCDECNQAFHLYCLRPALGEVPHGDWFCPACIPQTKRRRSRETNYRKLAGGSSSDDDESGDSDEMEHDEECAVCGGTDSIIQCSSCPSAFHLDCHEPPLRHTPRSNWSCMQCKSGIRLRSKRRAARASRQKKSYVEEDSIDDDDDEEEEEEEEEEEAEDDEEDEDDEEQDEDEEEEEEGPPKKVARTSSSHSSRRSDPVPSSSSSSRRSRLSEPPLVTPSPRARSRSHPSGGASHMNGDVKDELDICISIVDKLCRNKNAWPFLEPVDSTLVPDYYDIVHNPVDFLTMKLRCQTRDYKRAQDFINDMALMFNNAELYNKGDSEVGKCIAPVEKAFHDSMKKHFPDCRYSREDRLPAPPVALGDHGYSQ